MPAAAPSVGQLPDGASSVKPVMRKLERCTLSSAPHVRRLRRASS